MFFDQDDGKRYPCKKERADPEARASHIHWGIHRWLCGNSLLCNEMSEIVHITFEKLTGLRGKLEGWFECDPKSIDQSVPIIFDRPKFGCVVFRQQGKDIRLFYPKGTAWTDKVSFVEHFRHGVNFLISIDGRGEPIKHSNSPN